MGKFMKGAAFALGLLTVAEAGGAAYFYRRTMKRNKAKVERTVKMSGTDWDQYRPFIGERKEFMLAQPHEDVYVRSEDGLKLHATYFPNGETDKAVICFHGYTSQGMSDYIGLSGYYLRNGYRMLLVDARAHGESEGEYIGFGCLDRYDARVWIQWMIEECGEDIQLLLHGTSMGGATVLMTMYHLPAFPMIQIADAVNRKKAGYGLDECNAKREAANIQVPVLLIHGDADGFVPCGMCREIHENCKDAKQLIVEGAGHAESYYKDTEAYEKALDDFVGGIIK